MSLMLVWVSFIVLVSLSNELDQFNYFIFSGFMFYFTYVFNKIKPLYLPSHIVILLLTIPSFILGYVLFVYNDFLCLNPISYELFITLLFVYIYLMIYIFIEHSYKI